MTNRFNNLKNLLMAFVAIICAPLIVSTQGLVINEIDATVGEGEQFVELYGAPGESLGGYTLALVSSSFLGGGEYEPIVYYTIDLNMEYLDEDGFAQFPIELNPTIAAVVLYEIESFQVPTNEAPPTDDIVDALVYGNTSANNPQASVLLDALMPEGSVMIHEGLEDNPQGHSLARIPDGGEVFDVNSYQLQAPTQGFTNILACDGGHLELTNLINDTLCTDQGPAIATFIHFSDAPFAQLTLLVVDPSTGEVVASANGPAINFQNLGDGEFEVIAISHDTPLDPTSIEQGELLENVTGEGCFSISNEPYLIFAMTCETPACDGGTMLDASGSNEVLVCLSDEGTFVPFGYYSEAVEDDFLFAICDESNTILATTTQPYYDFTDLGADVYHIWGVSTQGELDSTTVDQGALVFGASAIECDSVGVSALEVTVLQCGDAGLCDDLIISEYVEGDSHNKAIEIHNPSSITINLEPYSVEVYNNGATDPTQQLELEGQLLPGEVFVIGNSQATPLIQNLSTTLSQVTWYNGNDAIVLLKNSEPIDIMGIIGEDPGQPWTVTSGGAMAEFTLVRKPNIGHGTTDWAEGMTQWDSYPQDTFDFLGSHTATCGGLGTMQIGFDSPELYVFEGGGVEVSMSPTYPLEDVVMQVSVVGGDATIGIDYPDVFPLEFNFDMGLLNQQTFTFTAIDEEDPELQEDVLLALSAVSGEAELGIDTVVVHILPSDLEYPVYQINQVRGTNIQGVLDSIDTACELRGIVHGWNDYPSGLQFTLIDETNGINAFSPVSDFGYDVEEGDSVRVRGVIDQYLGLAQIRLDTLIYEGSGFDTETPSLVAEMDEQTESRMVKLKCVELVDPNQWTNSTPGFEVAITFGSQDLIMRIDANTNLFGQPAPIGVFGVTGIGGQRDYNAPYVDGYTITPRGQFDLTEPVLADFLVVSPWDGSNGHVEIFNLSTGAGSYLWSMGDGTSYQDATPEHFYTSDGTFTITLTALSEDGECSSQITGEIESNWVFVDEIESNEVSAYPNPTKGSIIIDLKSKPVSSWSLYDSIGSLVLSKKEPGVSRITLDLEGYSTGIYSLILGEGYSPIRIILR
ncbi:MAG: hypothetical protein CL847_00535 [Crocinitomicaceae bacterium]|nr:hypothetical protein [Crocinitomicaceae bacterium]